MCRDLTKQQFDRKLQKYGMRNVLFGYVDVGNGVHVYRFNAGDKRRTQLAYLIEQQRKHQRPRQ